VVQGSKDELVDAAAVEGWLFSLKDRSVVPPQMFLLPEADHFFHARLHEVRDAVSRFVTDYADERSE
jgi:alpha/beta superfamily hydrolase